MHALLKCKNRSRLTPVQRQRARAMTQVQKDRSPSGATNGKTNLKPNVFGYFRCRLITIGSALSEAMSSENAYKTCVESTILIDVQGSPGSDWDCKVRGQMPPDRTLTVMAIGPKTLTPKLWISHAFGPEARRILWRMPDSTKVLLLKSCRVANFDFC